MEIGSLLTREVKDPGIGFVTITRVRVTPDLQIARVYYTALGDAAALKRTKQALERVKPFLRSQIGRRIRLRRVPELEFFFDESIEQQHRLEQLFQEIHAADAGREHPASDTDSDDPDRG